MCAKIQGKMTNIRVRIAPSPTGIPHIGNTRTALFNYLFAKSTGGKFIVRIEDTDLARLVSGSQEKILEIFKWLGLDYDEGPEKEGAFGPYIQSQRLGLYKKYAQELILKKRAYEEDGAIRFQPKTTGETSWIDLIHGEIKIPNDVIEPFVILKSDGFPTYHLANVVDDHLMEISHVLRGDEWISSTPKHIQIYAALGWSCPQFGHLPLILGPDKTKLSKRHGAQSALDYRDQGYLKEAIINFMALLGWNPKTETEIFSLDDLVKIFKLKDINKNNPVFDIKKLAWFNGKYIRELKDEDLFERLKPFLPKEYKPEIVKKVIPLIKDRIEKLTDFAPLTSFLFTDTIELEEFKVESGKLKVENTNKIINEFSKLLSTESGWGAEKFEKTGRGLVETMGLKVGDVFMVLRLAVSGRRVTPPLFESLEILGKEKTILRLKNALD